MERSDVETIFDTPVHPYTQGLLRSLPKLGEDRHRLEVIPGTVPDPLNFPAGCKFHPRCPYCGQADDKCRTAEPQLEEIEPGHWTACWKAREIFENMSK